MDNQRFFPRNGMTRRQVVNEFVERKEGIGWFTNRNNTMFGQRQKVEKFLEYWIETGKFGPDYDDHALIETQNRFEQTLEELYYKPEDKDDAELQLQRNRNTAQG